jgi:DNA polymerase-3 subunit delta'
MAQFLPWQMEDAKRLLAHTDHLPHALLVHGLSGIGKREFVQALATALLCEDLQGGQACGHCQSCLWIAAGHHPDLKLVRPEAVADREGVNVQAQESELKDAEASAAKKKLSEEIKVDQVRALEAWYHRSTHRGRWRIVVLYPADALSVISANALLKALEEPPPNTIFLLTSDAPDRLLPTIISRCQKFALSLPAKQQCEQWLAVQGVKQPEQWLAAAGGAPLAALSMAQSQDQACPAWAYALVTDLSKGSLVDVPGLADNLAKSHASEWIHVLQRLAVDVSLACAQVPVRYYPGLQDSWVRLAGKTKAMQAQELCGWLSLQARLANHPLSPKLFAQVCLQRFCDAVI